MTQHSSIWHHGKKSANQMQLQISDSSDVIQHSIPRKIIEVQTIKDALAWIFDNHNLQRISGFADDNGKFHRWSFSDCAGLACDRYFFDTEKNVIIWVQRMMLVQFIHSFFAERGIKGNFIHCALREVSPWAWGQFFYSLANQDIITRSEASLYQSLLERK
jgi:hypothetical protein